LYFLLFLKGCIKRRFVHLIEIGVQQEPVEVAFMTSTWFVVRLSSAVLIMLDFDRANYHCQGAWLDGTDSFIGMQN